MYFSTNLCDHTVIKTWIAVFDSFHGNLFHQLQSPKFPLGPVSLKFFSFYFFQVLPLALQITTIAGNVMVSQFLEFRLVCIFFVCKNESYSMIKTENSPSWFTFSVKPRTVHFVLLFCKERLIFRIVSRCITHMQSQCTVHPFVQRRLRCRCLKEPVRQQYCALRARALLEIEVCIHRDVIMMSLYFQASSRLFSTDLCTKP